MSVHHNVGMQKLKFARSMGLLFPRSTNGVEAASVLMLMRANFSKWKQSLQAKQQALPTKSAVASTNPSRREVRLAVPLQAPRARHSSGYVD